MGKNLYDCMCSEIYAPINCEKIFYNYFHACITDFFLKHSKYPTDLSKITMTVGDKKTIEKNNLIIFMEFLIRFYAIVRAETLSFREHEYVQAARTLGASPSGSCWSDTLPDVAPTVIVYATLLIPGAIVAEATLSFLGLSVVPPTPSWGSMLADAMVY